MPCSFGLSATNQLYFFSEQTNHHQLGSSTFHSEHTSTSTNNQPPAKRTGLSSHLVHILRFSSIPVFSNPTFQTGPAYGWMPLLNVEWAHMSVTMSIYLLINLYWNANYIFMGSCVPNTKFYLFHVFFVPLLLSFIFLSFLRFLRLMSLWQGFICNDSWGPPTIANGVKFI
jgi:hypothetical protein